MAKSYTTLRNLFGSLSTNTASTNLTLFDQLANDAHRRYLEKYFFNEATTTIVTVANQQEYALPYNYAKLKTGTLTIGVLKWTPKEILTRQEWDQLNVFPYYADIPSHYFIYRGKFNLWPIPATAGNTITFNYQKRIPDLSIADYTTGTVTVTNGSTAVVGAGGMGWLANYLPSAGSVLNLNLWLKVSSPKGDDNWYQISSITDATNLVLVNSYDGATTSGASYTIGQMPLLLEDYHDILVFDSLVTYFSSIVNDPKKMAEFKLRRDEIKALMDIYVGTKALSVNLARPRVGSNPNLYQSNVG
jgi:hypothetical protein